MPPDHTGTNTAANRYKFRKKYFLPPKINLIKRGLLPNGEEREFTVSLQPKNLPVKYKRILLKLSGEALMGDKEFGIDHARLGQYAKEIKQIADADVQVAVVIGGGNIFRGIQ